MLLSRLFNETATTVIFICIVINFWFYLIFGVLSGLLLTLIYLFSLKLANDVLELVSIELRSRAVFPAICARIEYFLGLVSVKTVAIVDLFHLLEVIIIFSLGATLLIILPKRLTRSFRLLRC